MSGEDTLVTASQSEKKASDALFVLRSPSAPPSSGARSEFVRINPMSRGKIKVRRCAKFLVAGPIPLTNPACDLERALIELKRPVTKLELDPADNSTVYVALTPNDHTLYRNYKYMVTMDEDMLLDTFGNGNPFQVLGAGLLDR